MSVRRTHNRVKEKPYGKDFSDVLKRSKVFNTTTVYFDGKKIIRHDDFAIFPHKNLNGEVIWYCGYDSSAFKKPEGTINFHWNGKRWEETKGGF